MSFTTDRSSGRQVRDLDLRLGEEGDGKPFALVSFLAAGVIDMTQLDDAHIVFPDLFRDDVLHIETRRLWLRWPMLSDAQALHSVAWREALARNAAVRPQPFPASEPSLWIAEARGGNEAGLRLDLAIAEKSRPGSLIGLIGVRSLGPANELSLGFLLEVEHQGQGLMTEAVRALAGMVFRYTEATVIHGSSGIANVASKRVMEKAGFRCVERSSGQRPQRTASVAGCPSLVLRRSVWRGTGRRGSTNAVAAEAPCGCAA